MPSSSSTTKQTNQTQFLNQVKAAKQERANQQKLLKSILLIQTKFRSKQAKNDLSLLKDKILKEKQEKEETMPVWPGPEQPVAVVTMTKEVASSDEENNNSEIQRESESLSVTLSSAGTTDDVKARSSPTDDQGYRPSPD